IDHVVLLNDQLKLLRLGFDLLLEFGDRRLGLRRSGGDDERRGDRSQREDDCPNQTTECDAQPAGAALIQWVSPSSGHPSAACRSRAALVRCCPGGAARDRASFVTITSRILEAKSRLRMFARFRTETRLRFRHLW